MLAQKLDMRWQKKESVNVKKEYNLKKEKKRLKKSDHHLRCL